MKTKVLSVLMLGAMFAMTACSSDDDLMDYQASKNQADVQKAATATCGRTVLVYMAGRNDLSVDLDNDLKEMKVGSKKIGDNDNLIVFVRRINKKNQAEMPWVARIRGGEVTDSVSVADIGITCEDPQASDPEVMEKVLSYAYSHYPAKKDYGLVLWGHGSGWIIEDHIACHHETRGYGVDWGQNNDLSNWINIPTIKGILEKMPHLRFIMGDCCNLMCLETLYELRQTTDYVIGSTVEIPSNGALYDQIVPDMFADGEFWKGIVDKYFAAQRKSLPLSVVKTSEMDHVATATRNVLPKVKEKIGNGYADMMGSVHYYNLYKDVFKPEYNIFYDGGEFVMRNAPKADYEQWKQTLDKAVIYKVNTQTKMWATNKYWSTHYVDFTITDEKYHGVSMFVPQDPTTGYYSALNEKIKELSWYYAVGLEVLDKN